jgi:hypothetical protein
MPLSQWSDGQFFCVIIMYFEVCICELCPDSVGIWELKYNIEILVVLIVGFKILAAFSYILMEIDGYAWTEVA